MTATKTEPATAIGYIGLPGQLSIGDREQTAATLQIGIIRDPQTADRARRELSKIADAARAAASSEVTAATINASREQAAKLASLTAKISDADQRRTKARQELAEALAGGKRRVAADEDATEYRVAARKLRALIDDIDEELSDLAAAAALARREHADARKITSDAARDKIREAADAELKELAADAARWLESHLPQLAAARARHAAVTDR